MGVYVVTGGAGFIGSNIVCRLAQDGHEVRVLDDLSTGHRENLADLAGTVDLREGTILDAALLEETFAGADCVFHQAAMVSVQQSVDDPAAAQAVNADGTLCVLTAARQAGVRRVVYASSCAVYGSDPTLPKREDMAPCPQSPYAASKLAGEHHCRAFAQAGGLETVALRYFNVYGPRQDPSSQYAAVIPAFISHLLAGESPTVYGDGEQSRDFVFIGDVVQANLRAAEAPGAGGAVVNVGCGGRHTLNELIALLQRLTGHDVKPIYADARPGDVRHSQADIARARQVLGYEPRTTLEEGLRQAIDWLTAEA
jgi:UDP-glucose 4-epimerase